MSVKMKKTVFAILAFVLMIGTLCSCSDIFSNKKLSDGIVVQGCIYTESEAARTAFPMAPLDSDYRFSVEAKQNNKTVTATIDSQEEIYLLTLPSNGKWEITAKGFTAIDGTEKQVLQDTAVIDVKTTDQQFIIRDFFLKPFMTSQGTGGINLSVTLASSINKVITTCKSSNWKFNELTIETDPLNSTRYAVLSSYDIPSGSYEVTFNFYSDSEAKNLVYSFIQMINIFDNLTTNQCKNTGNEEYISQGYMVVTDAMLDNYAQRNVRTTYYVDSNASASTKTGSFQNPMSSISSAIEKINTQSEGTYYIYVKDGSKEEVTQTIQIGMNHKIFVECYKNSITDKQGTATIKSKTDAEFIHVQQNSEAGFNGITFDGQGSTSDIDIDTLEGKHVINNLNKITFERCVIKNFIVKGLGRNLLYNTSDGTTELNLISTSIKNCFAPETLIKNSSSGTLTMTDSTIENYGAYAPSAAGNPAILNNSGIFKFFDSFIGAPVTDYNGVEYGISNSANGKIYFKGSCHLANSCSIFVNTSQINNFYVLGTLSQPLVAYFKLDNNFNNVRIYFDDGIQADKFKLSSLDDEEEISWNEYEDEPEVSYCSNI